MLFVVDGAADGEVGEIDDAPGMFLEVEAVALDFPCCLNDFSSPIRWTAYVTSKISLRVGTPGEKTSLRPREDASVDRVDAVGAKVDGVALLLTLLCKSSLLGGSGLTNGSSVTHGCARNWSIV